MLFNNMAERGTEVFVRSVNRDSFVGRKIGSYFAKDQYLRQIDNKIL